VAPEWIYGSSRSAFLRDDSYRWIDEATFDISQGADGAQPAELLAALLVNEHYVNTYQYADRVAGDVHEASSFATNEDQFRARLREVTQLPEPVGTPQARYQNLWRTLSGRTGDVHGPYFLSDISVETFDLLNGRQAHQALLQWLEDDERGHPAPGHVEGDLDGILGALPSAEYVFRLHDLGETAEHAAGPFLQPYLELVVVDLATAALRLIAAGTD